MATNSQADYRAMLGALLPPGRAWQADPGSPLDGVLNAWAEEFARLSARLENLLRLESSPLTATELLPAWERALGLPEAYAPLPTTIEGRREWAWAKLNEVGGQSIVYLVALAARLGWAVQIKTFRPFVAGSPCGTPCYGVAWAYHLEVHAPATTIRLFRAGSGAGEPLRVWGEEARLEGAIRDDRPAHVTVSFVYDL